MQFLKHSAMIPQDKKFSINNQVKAQSDKNISDLGKKIYCSLGSHQSSQSNDSYMPISSAQKSCIEIASGRSLQKFSTCQRNESVNSICSKN